MDEGEDWKDVQIPAKKKSASEVSSEASTGAAAAPSGGGQADEAGGAARAGEHRFEHTPNVGPAASLLMAQYGIKSARVYEVNIIT